MAAHYDNVKDDKGRTVKCGDYVHMLDGELPGNVGLYGGAFVNAEGVVTYVVTDDNDSDAFWYVSGISLYKSV